MAPQGSSLTRVDVIGHIVFRTYEAHMLLSLKIVTRFLFPRKCAECDYRCHVISYWSTRVSSGSCCVIIHPNHGVLELDLSSYDWFSRMVDGAWTYIVGLTVPGPMGDAR